MNINGQFVKSDNTKVEVEFPCPSCGKTVEDIYKIDSEPHKDETAVCECGEAYDITITHDEGNGMVNVDALGVNQNGVKARGIK